MPAGPGLRTSCASLRISSSPGSTATWRRPASKHGPEVHRGPDVTQDPRGRAAGRVVRVVRWPGRRRVGAGRAAARRCGHASDPRSSRESRRGSVPAGSEDQAGEERRARHPASLVRAAPPGLRAVGEVVPRHAAIRLAHLRRARGRVDWRGVGARLRPGLRRAWIAGSAAVVERRRRRQGARAVLHGHDDDPCVPGGVRALVQRACLDHDLWV